MSLLEKAIATHSSTLAWKIPWTEEPGRLQSMGSLRVGHNWATSLSVFTFMRWRRKWQPTPVFLPEKSHGRRSLAVCSPKRWKESDMTEWLSMHPIITVIVNQHRQCRIQPDKLCRSQKLFLDHHLRTPAWKTQQTILLKFSMSKEDFHTSLMSSRML